jgi:flagellar export protein FliJ
MNLKHIINSLAQLAALREREAEQAGAELSRQQLLVSRYQRNLERLRQMLNEVGMHSAGHAVLASNSAHYKASLVDMIVAHRKALAAQEQATEAARTALECARQRHQRIDSALQQKRIELRHAFAARDQKRQDQMALQSWVHARHHATTH